MISSTPARILGIADKKGTIEKGKDADIVIFDEHIHVETTIIKGKICFSNTGL
jgi:N-acetylglucosamine-6-phosphate deacetylase